MSEVELVNGPPADEGALDDGGPDDDDADNLDEEATALLKELQESQLEVQRMIAEQRVQASELGGMKESLVSELQQLQDESWKLQVFAELEMLKRQLAAINSLDADLDAMEARLDEAEEGDGLDESFDKELAAARAGTRELFTRLGRDAGTALTAAEGVAETTDTAPATASGRLAAGDGTDGALTVVAEAAGAEGNAAEEGNGEDGGDVEALQDELDAELAAMFKQLQDIKAESALVAARKAQLEMELMQLLRDGAEEVTAQLTDLSVDQAAEEGAEEAAEEGAEEAAEEGAEEAAEEGAEEVEGQGAAERQAVGHIPASEQAPAVGTGAEGLASSGAAGEGSGSTA